MDAACADSLEAKALLLRVLWDLYIFMYRGCSKTSVFGTASFKDPDFF
jgi:hypothetical protein